MAWRPAAGPASTPAPPASRPHSRRRWRRQTAGPAPPGARGKAERRWSVRQPSMEAAAQLGLPAWIGHQHSSGCRQHISAHLWRAVGQRLHLARHRLRVRLGRRKGAAKVRQPHRHAGAACGGVRQAGQAGRGRTQGSMGGQRGRAAGAGRAGEGCQQAGSEERQEHAPGGCTNSKFSGFTSCGVQRAVQASGSAVDAGIGTRALAQSAERMQRHRPAPRGSSAAPRAPGPGRAGRRARPGREGGRGNGAGGWWGSRQGGAAAEAAELLVTTARCALPLHPHQQLVSDLAQLGQGVGWRQRRGLGHPVQQPRVQPLCARGPRRWAGGRAAVGRRLGGSWAMVRRPMPCQRRLLQPEPAGAACSARRTCDQAQVAAQGEGVEQPHHAGGGAAGGRSVQVPQRARLLCAAQGAGMW